MSLNEREDILPLWAALPEVPLLRVMRAAGLKDFLCCRTTCVAWHTILSRPGSISHCVQNWGYLQDTNKLVLNNLTAETAMKIIRLMGKSTVQSLHLVRVEGIEHEVVDWLAEHPLCKRLKSLDVSYTLVTYEQVARFRNLGIKVTSRGCWRASRPCPAHTAKDVVETQLLALKHNNDDDDEGLEACFLFASPANRIRTGTLEHFSAMVRSGYPNLLNLDSFSIQDPDATGRPGVVQAELGVHGDDDERTKMLLVTVTKGRAISLFAWILSKQPTDPEQAWSDTWMTDGVLGLAPPMVP
eukprot:m.2529 g.2529  ORF g.2529 m.2529 type:complete len:299 (+) comp1551_c0_seq1:235-1131(+)